MARLRSHKIALQSSLPLTTKDQALEAVTHVTVLECPLIRCVCFSLVPPDEARIIFQRSTILSEPPVTSVKASLQAAQMMFTVSVIWASCLHCHYFAHCVFENLTYFPINKKTDTLVFKTPFNPFVGMGWDNERPWAAWNNPLIDGVYKNLPHRRGQRLG